MLLNRPSEALCSRAVEHGVAAVCAVPADPAAFGAAVRGGVDFPATATGKIARGATLEAATLFLQVIDESGGRVGLEVSGGIRTASDAAPHLAPVESMLGTGWISPDRQRFEGFAWLDGLVRVAGTASTG
jgi:deoxyribose-phosphate aldolase